MVGESNQNVFLIQTDASSFAEFEISEFEIVRVDCINLQLIDLNDVLYRCIEIVNSRSRGLLKEHSGPDNNII